MTKVTEKTKGGKARLTDSHIGQVSQIVGVVVDVDFPANQLPAIYNALTTKIGDKEIYFEVAHHLSESSVRAVALSSTDGLKRGASVVDTGSAISVPVGKATLGRMFNVIGDPIDGKGSEGGVKTPAPIHREPPALSEQSGKIEVLETGIKAIDLICPVTKGGKAGLFGGAGVGKTILI